MKGKDQIIVKKCIDEALAIPVGAILTHVNDDDITTKSASETIQSLETWSDADQGSTVSLVLRFFVKPSAGPSCGSGSATQPAEETGDPVRNIFIRDISQKSKSKLGVDLSIPYIKTICSVNR